jgi:anti-anti-sigma factor
VALQGWEPGERAGDVVDDVIHVAVVRQLLAVDAQVIVRVAGVVDLVTAPSLATGLALALDCATAGQEITEIVVDLRLVRFLSAAGLGELARGHQQCRRSGVPLRVVADQWSVTRPLRVTGLDRTLRLRPDLDLPENIPADLSVPTGTAATTRTDLAR